MYRKLFDRITASLILMLQDIRVAQGLALTEVEVINDRPAAPRSTYLNLPLEYYKRPLFRGPRQEVIEEVIIRRRTLTAYNDDIPF